MTSENRIVDAVGKALGEPAFTEFSENAWKIRTNLVLVSLIAIAVVFGELHIEPDSQIFGLKFKGLSDEVLQNCLVAIIGYLLIHFLWVSSDALLEWRLRITGTRVGFVTTARLASEHGDYPSDPRQSTLYNWWKEEANKIGNMDGRLGEIETRLTEWEAKISEQLADKAPAQNIINSTMSVGGVRQEIMTLRNGVNTATAAIAAARVPQSLHRFDSWFSLFLRSQNLRWLLIDFLAPVFAGGYALLLLLST